MAKIKIFVIILNWNGLTDTLECLDSLSKSKTPTNFKLHTIVVDNASTDGSLTAIKTKYPQIEIIANSVNSGFAAGNNIGITHALKSKADYIILLNNDTTVDSHTITKLVTSAKKNNFHLASPKIYFYPGREFHHNSYQQSEIGKIIWYAGGIIDWPNVITTHRGVDEYDHGQFDLDEPTPFATGCCLLIHKSVPQKIGLLSTSYKMYFEDTDYCMKAQKNNFKIGFVASSHMWHKNAGSTGGSGSTKQSQAVTKSRLRFGLYHAPLRAKLALLKQYSQL